MKKTVVITVAAVLAVALAAFCGYAFCTRITIQDAALYATIPLYIILLLLGGLIAELIHEGAHLLIGVICSMGVSVPKIRLFKSSSVDVYPKGAKCMRARMILTAAAGLAFTLILIVVGVISLAVPTVPIVFALPFPYALYSFIVNVVPVEYDGGKTDGLVVWELITNKPTAQVMLAVLRVQGLVHDGMLMQELDEGLLLDVPQVQEDDINFIVLTQLRYEYYLAKGNDSEAYKYFLRYKDLIQYLPSEYKDNK